MTDVFQNSISNEFSVFKSLSDDSSLLVALYTRYKKCIDSGGEDCLEVAIGTIKEFFQQAQSNTGAKLTDEELLDLYEDYYEETTQLEWVDTTWDEYMGDLEKSELNRLMGISQQEQQEQDIDEEEADKDEGFEIPEQIEPPDAKIEPDKEDLPQTEQQDGDYIVTEMPPEQDIYDYLSSRNYYWNNADESLLNGFYTEVENQLQAIPFADGSGDSAESKSVNITEYYDELESLMAEIYDYYRSSTGYGQLGNRGNASVYDNRNASNFLDGLLDSAYDLAEYYGYDFSKIDIESLATGNEDQQALYQSLVNVPMESSYNNYTLEQFQKFLDKQNEGLSLVEMENNEFTKMEVFQSFYELWKYSDLSINELSQYIDDMGQSLAELQSTYSDFQSQKELYDIILDYMTEYGIDSEFDPDNISYDDDNRYSVNPPEEEEAPTDPMNYAGGYAYDSQYGTNFMTNYKDGKFYFTKSTFQSVFPDLYNALNDAGLLETGVYNFNRGTADIYMQTIAFSDDIQRAMMTAYMAEVFGALEGMSSETLSNISGLNDQNQTILRVMYDVYNDNTYSDEQKIAILSAYIFNDDYGMPFVNIAGAIEKQIGYAGQQGFFQNFADLQNDFYEINPNSDINDIIAYIQNNPTDYYTGEYDTESVIDYYGEQGYIYDRDDNELLTEEEYYDKYDISYTQIQAPDIDRMTEEDINSGITYTTDEIKQNEDGSWSGGALNPERNRSENYRRWASISTNDDGTLSVQFYSWVLKDTYNELYQQMRSDGFIDANSNIQGDPTAFLNVMTNLMYDLYLQDGYYKDWDTTTEFWTNNINMGADGIEDILDELVNWYNIYGSFDDLSQSTDYEEMMDAVMILAGLNSDRTDVEFSDGIYGFYQYYNSAKYYFEQINPNYSVQDIFNYLQGKRSSEALVQLISDPTATSQEIAQYYTDEGYVVDRETGELISPEQIEERELREEDDVYDDPQDLYEYLANELGDIIDYNVFNQDKFDYLNGMWKNWGYDSLLDYAGAMKEHFIEFVNAVMKSKSEPYTYDQLNDEALYQLWDEYFDALYLYDGELRDMDDRDMVKSISKAGQDLPEGEQLERDDVKGTQIFDDPQTIYEYMVNEFGDIIDFNKYTEDKFWDYIEEMKSTWGFDDSQTYYSEMLNHYIEFVNIALDKFGQSSTYYDISDTARATYLDEYLDALYNFDGELRELDDTTYERYMEQANNTIGDEANLYDLAQEEDEGQVIDTGTTNYVKDIMEDAGIQKALNSSTGDFYHIVNEDGTTDLYYYNQDTDTYYQIAENYDGDLQGKSTEINEDNITNYDFPESMTNDMFSELTERELQEILKDMPQVGDHKTDVNNAINVMQITESMGEVKLNQRQDKSRNLRYGNLRDKVAFEVRHDGVSRLSNQPNEAEMIFQTEQGRELLRLDGSQRKLTTKEWKIINDSYLYDRDVSKPFIIDKMEDDQQSQYQVNYNNVYEYYFEVANRNPDFFVWLDSYSMGEEGRSYVNYRVNSKIQANNVDINSYKKTGSILDLIPSVDFQPHFTNQGSQAQEKAILETHALGIEDVNAFVLVSALCSLFSNIIMENSKHIGKNSLIQKFEGGIKNNEYSSLKDNVYTGLYKEGSQILNAINGSTELSEDQKAVLNSIFTQRSFSSMAEWEANNRYGEIVLKFFGNNDTRNHKLENNSGKVLFELGLIYISYYACMMDNDNLMGIDLNEKSNLIKLTSEFLETLYPAQKYDQNLLIGIDNMMKVITNDVRNIKRGSVANEITAKDLLSDVIRQFINIAFNETPTTFNIYEFFDEEMLGHISNNFGLDMYMKIGDFNSFVDFIADGFLDSQQFNNMIKSVMTSTMGDKFSFTGNEMLETLFMSEVQAQTFINNSKFNLLIPLIHPEIVGLIPPEKVQINLWGFNYKIVGLVQYDKKTPIYDTAIQDDINFKTPLFQNEPEFITEEDAEKRAGLLGLIGTHQHDDGSYMAGESHEQLEVLYDGMALNNGDLDYNMKHFQNISKDNFKDARKIEDTEHRVMVEDEEDVLKVENNFEMGDDIDDWKYAGILEILNSQSKDIEPKEQGSLRGAKPTEGKTLKDTLKSTITDFENIEIIYPNEGDNYIIINDGDNVYVAFRGSKGFFEYEDWWGETGNLINMDTKDFYSMTTAGLGQSHQGFKKGYEKMKTELLDNLQGVLKSDTKLHIIGHSRGTAFADQLVEDAIRIHPKDKIKYRGYGYITHRNKESADAMNKKIEGVDYMTYHIAGDPLRLLTKVLPYYPVGSNKVITGYEEGFKGNPFYAVDVNTLQGIRDDDAGALQTGMEDMWKILRTPLASQHFITGYKNLLAQDKHEFKFKKKQEESLNTPFTYLVAGALLYGGFKAYKTIQGVKAELGLTEDTLMEASQGGLDLMDEMDALRAEHAEDVEFYENAIEELEAEKLALQESIPEQVQSAIMNAINQLSAQMEQRPSSEVEQPTQIETPETSGEAPPMGSFDDPAIMENGGKVDEMVKVDKYECGGKISKCDCEDKEEGVKAEGLPTYECGGKVEEPKTEVEDYDDLDKFEKGGKVPDNVKNPALYKKAKAKYANMKHSAYKSSLIVKDYKKRGGKYSGKKTNKGLTRWHKEDWRTASGSKTYKKKGDIFRPTKRISKDTPTTMGELSKDRIKRAEGEKARTGKVKRYMKGGRVSKKDMPCNKPQKSTREGKRKMVKACANGQEKLIHYGDSVLGAHPDDPNRKKNFRARHRCDKDPPSKLSARYWACKDW